MSTKAQTKQLSKVRSGARLNLLVLGEVLLIAGPQKLLAKPKAPRAPETWREFAAPHN